MIPVTGIIKILRTQEKRIGKDVWRLQTSWLPSGLAIHASGLCPHSHWHCALDHHVSFCAFSLSHSFLLHSQCALPAISPFLTHFKLQSYGLKNTLQGTIIDWASTLFVSVFSPTFCLMCVSQLLHHENQLKSQSF
jgi:hypothetical protein